MHLAILIPSFEKGGIERSIIRISKEMIKLGYKIDLLVVQINPDMKDLIDGPRIIYLSRSNLFHFFKYLLPRSIYFNLVSFWGLIRYLKKAEPDYLMTARNAFLAVFVKFFIKIKTKIVIREPLHISSVLNKHSVLNKNLISYFKRVVYKYSDKVIAISEGVSQDLIDNFNLSPNKVKIIYNPSADPEIKNLSNENFEHPWFKQDIPIIIAIGRLTEQKNFYSLVDSFSLVRKEKESKLIIIGEGRERKKIETLISEKSLEKDVELIGFQKNPWKYLSKSSLFVLSSLWEGFGNVIVESMYLGVPVISTDCPSGPREILDNGNLGYLVPSGDSESLAKKIIEFLNSPEEFIEKSLKAQKQSLNFLPSKIAQDYIRELF